MRQSIKKVAGLIFDIVCIVVIISSLYSFITGDIVLPLGAGIVSVSGQSMYPTLADKDKLIISYNKNPEAGDIIVFNSNTNTDGKKRYFIKRVIATEGQTVDIRDGKVYVDDILLEESYYTGTTPLYDVVFPVKVSDGCVFVMGDNRKNSSDSRLSKIGLVRNTDVVGKVQLRLLPAQNFGIVK